MINIYAVPPDKIEGIWPTLEDMVKRALDPSHWLTPNGVLNFIKDGDMICLVITGEYNKVLGVQVGHKIEDGNGVMVYNLIILAGQEFDSWMTALDKTNIAMAREMDCTEIRNRGRIGMLKKLKKVGFKPAYFVASKKVT